MDELIHSFKYPFGIDAGLGKWTEEQDYSRHVDQMMRQVLFTAPGERINRPDFGCGLRNRVFSPNSDATANLTQVMIVQSLQKWLGNLLEVIDVKAVANDEKLEVSIVYMLKARQERRYLNLEVTI